MAVQYYGVFLAPVARKIETYLRDKPKCLRDKLYMLGTYWYIVPGRDESDAVQEAAWVMSGKHDEQERIEWMYSVLRSHDVEFLQDFINALRG